MEQTVRLKRNETHWFRMNLPWNQILLTENKNNEKVKKQNKIVCARTQHSLERNALYNYTINLIISVFDRVGKLIRSLALNTINSHLARRKARRKNCVDKLILWNRHFIVKWKKIHVFYVPSYKYIIPYRIRSAVDRSLKLNTVYFSFSTIICVEAY